MDKLTKIMIQRLIGLFLVTSFLGLCILTGVMWLLPEFLAYGKYMADPGNWIALILIAKIAVLILLCSPVFVIYLDWDDKNFKQGLDYLVDKAAEIAFKMKADDY